jgi:nucleotide-binding universal stress UspA family protein
MKKHRVLIPLDGSEFSRRIIPHICRLLDPATHKLILLHVAEPPVGLVGSPPRPVAVGWTTSMYTSKHDLEYAAHPIYANQVEQSERAAIEHTLLEEQQSLEKAGYVVSVLARFGDPAEEIIDTARLEAAGMVAMATHGRTGLRQLVLGSVAEQVLRRLPVPALLVRPFDQDADLPSDPRSSHTIR